MILPLRPGESAILSVTDCCQWWGGDRTNILFGFYPRWSILLALKNSPKNTTRTSGGGWLRKKRRLLSRPLACLSFAWRSRLTFDDVNDLVGVRAKNDVLAVHKDEIVSTPFRIDFHDT
jgi:hypothetical protein